MFRPLRCRIQLISDRNFIRDAYVTLLIAITALKTIPASLNLRKIHCSLQPVASQTAFVL